LLEFNCITFFTMQKLNIAKPVDWENMRNR
jgi:hypothetical protein